MDGNVGNNQTKKLLVGKIIEVPKIDETLAKEGYAAEAKTTGEELSARVKKTDIVNNLTTEDAKKPLSAAQGKVLKDMMDDMLDGSNKEYTGNGSEATQTISVNSNGRLALLYCSTHCSLVTQKGAWVTDLNTGVISWLSGTEIRFLGGSLVIGTANEACNKANETYYLQTI